MTFAINVTPPLHGLLSSDRLLRKFVSWAQPGPAIRDIQSSALIAPDPMTVVDPVLEVRLKEIAALGPGWDDGSALAIDPELIRLAQAFISSDLITSTPVKPDLVPTFDGGLLFEWHTQEVDLIIEIDSASGPTFYYHDNEVDEEIEAPLGEHLESLTTAFRKLMTIP